jgi:4-amino-4-deoxy-L-arabinose transferase-like glycosyltransferase
MAFMTSSPLHSDWQQRLYAKPWLGLLFLVCAHIVSRVAISSGMKWDESEQILWAQSLALGYGPQPPLYTWMQWAVCQVLGPSVLALAVLKHLLIGLTYCLAWLAGRQLLNEKGAWWVAGGLLLMPPFGWDSLRDQTHTVMVTAMTMGLWWAVLRQVQRPQAINFVWIGLFCALGMLSKYSYAMLIAALFVASMTVPAVRSALFAKGWWLAPLVGALVFAPHASWLASHWGMATTETVQKMSISAEVSHLKGLGNLAKALLATLGLWLIAVLLGYRSRLWKAALSTSQPATNVWAKPLLLRYLLIIAACLLGMVLVADVTDFKQRWMLPLMAIAPLALYVWRPALLEPGVGRSFTVIVLLFALIFLAMATLRPWQGGRKNDPDELNHPVKALAAQLRSAGYDGKGVIMGSDHMMAAMLHSQFPASYALGCSDGKQIKQCLAQAQTQANLQAQGPLLLITRADKPAPHWWEDVFTVLPSAPTHALSIPFEKMPASATPAQYQYLWITP